LLQRFASGREEVAFAALVRRHGPLVLGVCRRLLQDSHEAEDAFQATFLVLASKAGTIRKQASVGSWLFGVATRLATRMRTRAARRRALERRTVTMPATDPAADVTWGELSRGLHEEVNRLPETYRAPLLLCYWEGNTQDEAAGRLGWPRGTLKRRLERGRELLRGRLARRGLTLSAALIALMLSERQAGAAVPSALAARTVQSAARFAAIRGAAAPGISMASVLSRALVAAKLKLLLTVVLGGSVSTAASVVAFRAGPSIPPAAQEPARLSPAVVDRPPEYSAADIRLPPIAPRTGGNSMNAPAPAPPSPGETAVAERPDELLPKGLWLNRKSGPGVAQV
jgi:RNA polymerase sigma factor (sigma-70 family)